MKWIYATAFLSLLLAGCGYQNYDFLSCEGKCMYLEAVDYCHEKNLTFGGAKIFGNTITTGCMEGDVVVETELKVDYCRNINCEPDMDAIRRWN